jgi:hypothetical protein
MFQEHASPRLLTTNTVSVGPSWNQEKVREALQRGED